MKRNAILGIVIALVLLIIVGFYTNQIQVGYWMMGEATPLFIIYNEDSNSHEVDIEIFNSDNESILKELYVLDQSEQKEYPKPQTMTTSRSYHTYTFKVTLDNETTKIVSIDIDPWTTSEISLYHKSRDDDETFGEIIPLKFQVSVV